MHLAGMGGFCAGGGAKKVPESLCRLEVAWFSLTVQKEVKEGIVFVSYFLMSRRPAANHDPILVQSFLSTASRDWRAGGAKGREQST